MSTDAFEQLIDVAAPGGGSYPVQRGHRRGVRSPHTFDAARWPPSSLTSPYAPQGSTTAVIGVRVDELIGPAGKPFPDAYVIPGRRGDELLQLLMTHTQPGRHRLHRLALAVEHQPAQIQLTRGPLIRPWQFAEHLGGESHQTRPDLGHLLWSHEPSQDHTTGHKPGSDTPNKALLDLEDGRDDHRAAAVGVRHPLPHRPPD